MTTTELPHTFKASLESTKVEYVRLGKSGLKVSVPILGAMSIGDPAWLSWVIDEEKVCASLYVARLDRAAKNSPR
jgi:hypothetical protein